MRQFLKNDWIPYLASVLYCVLFTYAAVSKLLDFNNFQVQLGQSPILGSYAGILSYGVPIVELAIVIALAVPGSRVFGLYCSLVLMVLFTTYIYIILHYAVFVPCSCGGILEKLGWQEHLVFNIVFVLIALGAILVAKYTEGKLLRRTAGILALVFLSGAVMVGLYQSSEQLIRYHNNFTRRFPSDARKVADTDLGFNSYYWAGIHHGAVYLGNSTNPLLLTRLDTTLGHPKKFIIRLDYDQLPFRALHLSVYQGALYAVDGSIPAVFKGTPDAPLARLHWQGQRAFSYYAHIDSLTLVAKTIDEKKGTGILERITPGNAHEALLPGLLERQSDGNFDVDGTFDFDPDSGIFAYVYRYRNGIITTSRDFQHIRHFTTIDTFSRATVKTAYVKSRSERKLAAPPVVVNASCGVADGLLFVHSGIMGRYEPQEMWQQASIIDVYDLKSGGYRQSFYIYDIDGKKLRSFRIGAGVFYGFIGTHLVAYTLPKDLERK